LDKHEPEDCMPIWEYQITHQCFSIIKTCAWVRPFLAR
jgi:hypothetical protein